jgi:hypothetical protein
MLTFVRSFVRSFVHVVHLLVWLGLVGIIDGWMDGWIKEIEEGSETRDPMTIFKPLIERKGYYE